MLSVPSEDALTQLPCKVAIVREEDVHFITEMAREIGHAFSFDEYQAGMFALAISEIAMNTLNHADGGEFSLRITDDGKGLEAVIEDNGTGILDLPQARVDGYSGNGGLGLGIGAAERAVEELVISSHAGMGTKVTLRSYAKLPEKIDAVAFNYPAVGQIYCGDRAFVKTYEADKKLFCLIDGAGKGKKANDVAAIVENLIKQHYKQPLDELLRFIDHRLRDQKSEYGADVCIVRLTANQIEAASVGNAGCQIHCDQELHTIFAQPGSLGSRLPAQIQLHQFSLNMPFTLLMHSDGIDCPRLTEFELDSLSVNDLASQVFNSHAIDDDDAAIIVARSR